MRPPKIISKAGNAMINENQNFFEVKVNSKTYDIVTGSKEFYQFLGDRLYYKFDVVVPSEDRIKFRDRIANCEIGSGFEAVILDSNSNLVNMIVFVVAKEERDIVTLHFGDIRDLYKDLRSLEKNVRDCRTLLAQFNCMYYIYNKAKDFVICFKFNPDINVVTGMYVDDWYEKVKDIQDEEGNHKVEKLVSDIRNGIRSFRYSMAGEIFSKTNYEKEVEVCGSAIYEDGVHIKTIGSINNNKSSMIQDTIRRDQLTGLILKEDITNLAKNRIERKKPTAIAIIDIDDFKNVNDNFGHMKGDEVLKKCASIIADAVSGIGSAGRIGGDEFFIVVDVEKYENKDPLRTVLRSLKNYIGSAYSEETDGFKISTSIGCAFYPEDIDNFTELFLLADTLLYRAKSKGKNRYIIYNPLKHGSVEDILQHNSESIGISSRKGLAKSEIICNIADNILESKGYTLKNIFNDVVDYFGVERIMLYSKTRSKLVFQCGNKLLKEDITKETIDYIFDDKLEKMYNKGVFVVNDVRIFEAEAPNAYVKLRKQGVLSLMHHKIIGRDGEEFVVSYESVVIRNTWNQEDMHFFRILDHILARCL